jgi:23S rRNA (adenine2030-N6)-methyltransferase
MNYRHAFHAGNFADVVKHAVIARILTHLCEKPAPFRVIDTHAGAGLYDLAAPQAIRTQEWRDGIARLTPAAIEPAAARALLAPYLDAVAAFNPSADVRHYPGSPLLALRLMRAQDRLLACEHEPSAFAALDRSLRSDKRAKVLAIDGWIALRANVPPKERRGLVLIDPPYEDKQEFAHLAAHFESAYRKWPTGSYLLWYPIKGRSEPEALTRHLRKIGLPKLLQTEIRIAASTRSQRLTAAGLIIVNPPWKLHAELRTLLPILTSVLGQDAGAGFTLDWLAEK